MVTDETRLIILKHIEILQHYAVYQELTWFYSSINSKNKLLEKEIIPMITRQGRLGEWKLDKEVIK